MYSFKPPEKTIYFLRLVEINLLWKSFPWSFLSLILLIYLLYMRVILYIYSYILIAIHETLRWNYMKLLVYSVYE